jgi:hypothetical protein
MVKKYKKSVIVIALIAIILFGIIWLTLINLEVGMAKEVGVQKPTLPGYDLSAIPQDVYDDAMINANELVGKRCIKEFFEAAAKYPRKARDLSRRVVFLTDHIPELKVIIAGESLGTVISDRCMDILEGNTRVYSIQTGTPFWYQPAELDRKMLMNSNGSGIDTFSHGDLPEMVWATFKGWFGFTSPEDNPGNILNWLKAPGHDYSWQYPGISSAVITFLEANFPEKS